MAPRLRGLTPAQICDETELAQRYLASAYDSVNGMLGSLNKVRSLRKKQGIRLTGRLPGPEEDLLRAAILFACAGLDATLKQVVRDALPAILQNSPLAHEKFAKFVTQQVSLGEGTDPSKVARLLASPDPRGDLIEQYVSFLTGSSLQSASEVERTCGALGIDDSALRTRVVQMRSVFVARNQISHELDLQATKRRGDRSRRTRAMANSVSTAHEALDVAQAILNAVVTMLTPQG